MEEEGHCLVLKDRQLHMIVHCSRVLVEVEAVESVRLVVMGFRKLVDPRLEVMVESEEALDFVAIEVPVVAGILQEAL